MEEAYLLNAKKRNDLSVELQEQNKIQYPNLIPDDLLVLLKLPPHASNITGREREREGEREGA